MSNNTEKSKGGGMPPIITIFIILIILFTIGVTRVVIESEKISAAIKPDNTELLVEANLNNSEKEIITLLLGGSKIYEVQFKQDEHTYYILINCLKNYLTGSEIFLSSAQYEEMKEKANELIKIMNMEGDKDFTKMSLDGRAVAVDIARQIYESCGLRLDVTMNGDIEQISDQSGKVIYNRNELQLQSNFQIFALLITLSSIIILLGIILYISKKNYNREEVAYHGFNKKRYA